MVIIFVHDHAFYRSLGTTLRERRAALDLDQVDVAELAGCSTRFVGAAEAGKTTLRLDKLVAVLDVLGLNLTVRLSAGSTLEDRTGMPGVQNKVSGHMITLPVADRKAAWILKLNPPEFPSLEENEAFFLKPLLRAPSSRDLPNELISGPSTALPETQSCLQR